MPEPLFRSLGLKEGEALLAQPRRARVFAVQP
ncbi:sulfate transport ATP-binding protein [Bordetella pertussis]|nr:sulfate transport ATP-binding protein [Bordetella pertussis]CPL89537.1 sulfate transport ATP-binding protein [Bordetella pertussis]CRE08176.1 sulfate transport ATP-binding protein [Bordetella pertussis]